MQYSSAPITRMPETLFFKSGCRSGERASRKISWYIYQNTGL